MRKPRNKRIVWLAVFGCGLVGFGLWQLGSGLYIHAKALLAQQLLAKSWADTLDGAERVRPWPWSDAWPVARLKVPALEVDHMVLSNASGRSLAFGPGHVAGTAFPGSKGHVVLGGHRDTHFAFLADLTPGMAIRLQDRSGRWHSYRMTTSQIIDSRQARLYPTGERSVLTLVTCYPFDALRPGGFQRYLATAEAERPQVGQSRN